MNLKPLDDRLVVKRLDAEETTAGGIVLPTSAQEKPQQAEVLAVGPGKQLDNGSRAGMDIKVGDTIIFGKYAGTEVNVDEQDVIIMKESDILAIVK
ncbi:MAG: co-chaperone GroES [Planctomycetes bacterium]|nr:co-chaperone GroES [Planctomycetota bacterium]